jgi:two-component system chemotaxis response regulator CheB
MIRVGVFNDSKTLRARLRECLHEAAGFQIVLEAEDGRDAALHVERAQPDLVLMDVLMPHVDGYEATREIIEACPLPIVIVTAAFNPKDSAVIFRALATGALYVTSPPSLGDKQQTRAFLQLLRAMVGARPKIAPLPAQSNATALAPVSMSSRVSVIAMAASAGGPQALTQVLCGLPRSALPPILVVQHLAANFQNSFAAWLQASTGHKVVIAAQAQPTETGTVYLAGHGKHLEWGSGALTLSSAPPVAHFRPSATVLLHSLVKERQRGLAVILSGMGDDGAEGAAAMYAAGGHVVIQSRASAAVWGMPAEVERRGAAHVALAASEIAQHILTQCGIRQPTR